MPKVDDPSLKFPVSPLLLLNRQAHEEASTIVRQKVRLYCPAQLGLLMHSVNSLRALSVRQRNFVSEVLVSRATWNIQRFQAEGYMQMFPGPTRCVLGGMWSNVQAGEEDVQSLGIRKLGSEVEWFTIT